MEYIFFYIFIYRAINIKFMNKKSINKFHKVSELSVLKKFHSTVFKNLKNDKQ